MVTAKELGFTTRSDKLAGYAQRYDAALATNQRSPVSISNMTSGDFARNFALTTKLNPSHSTRALEGFKAKVSKAKIAKTSGAKF